MTIKNNMQAAANEIVKTIGAMDPTISNRDANKLALAFIVQAWAETADAEAMTDAEAKHFLEQIEADLFA